MWRNTLIWFLVVCVLPAAGVKAQTVLYAPALAGGAGARLEVAGKAGGFYWVHKAKNTSAGGKAARQKERKRDFSFLLYDARLNEAGEIPYTLSDAVEKEFLVAGRRYFDQVLLQKESGKITAMLNRFSADGSAVIKNIYLKDFATNLSGNDFLLARSADKTRILLLAFEQKENAPPYLHTTLFNEDWKPLIDTVFKNNKCAQPYLQPDETTYPLQAFDNSPVKVTNSGDWLMLAPSRVKDDYLLCHFRQQDSTLVYGAVAQPQGPAVQYAALSLTQEENGAMAGLLVNAGGAAHKKVRLACYNLATAKVDFDTTYRFRTQQTEAGREAYVYQQDFIPVPGKGFLYLKEFGRTYLRPSTTEMGNQPDEGPDSTNTQPVKADVVRQGYTRFSGVLFPERTFERGDLYLNYFPGLPTDSCWSGLLNMTQMGEMNGGLLSYACLPAQGRIVFLYNNVSFSFNKTNSSTIINEQGFSLEDGLVFWRGGNILNFQNARPVGRGELAVPYERNRMQGFAIIRMKDEN